MWGLTLGAADEQAGQCEGAGSNSYRSSDVKELDKLAADPWALGSERIRYARKHATANSCSR